MQKTAYTMQTGATAPPVAQSEEFNRPPRILNILPQDVVEVPKPSAKQPQPPSPGWVVFVMPLITVSIMFAVYIFVNHASLQQLSFLIPMAIYAIMGPISSLITTRQRAKAIRRENMTNEKKFKKALIKLRTKLQQQAEEQRRLALLTDPDPAALESYIQERIHLWERRPEDPDFLSVRVGKGKAPLSTTIKAPDIEMAHPVWSEIQRFKSDFATVDSIPLSVSLAKVKSLGITGRRQDVAALVRSMFCQITTLHSPEDVRILGIYPVSQRQDWDWLQIIPHTAPIKGCKLPRLIGVGQDEAITLLNFLLEELSLRATKHAETPEAPALPHLVVLVHDYVEVRKHPALVNAFKLGEQLGVSIIYLVAQKQAIPSECRGILRLSDEGAADYAATGVTGEHLSDIAADSLHLDQTIILSKLLSTIHIVSEEEKQAADLPTNVRFLDLIDLPFADQLDVEQWWSHPRFGRLRVPLGIGINGIVWLDLNDAAHGPHGIIAGTTGAGKSELLQSIIIGLALTHHPFLVNFVLVDFKGGAAFKPFEKLPHTVGMVTDLSGKLTERALVALKSELRRREHILSEANVKKIVEYQTLQTQNPTMQPLPNLLIIIDEFAELAKEHPAFMEGLVSVVQKGRSLGVHLILATQKPTGSVNANIWSNLKFRICLRVASLGDSRDMLGRSEAALLPSTIPGRAYFQIGAEIFEMFQSARVSLPARVANEASLLAARQSANGAEIIDQKVLIDALEPYQTTLGQKLFKPWPAPLPHRISLPEVYQRVKYLFPEKPSNDGQPPYGWLVSPVGMLDIPLEQRQEPWMLNLIQNGGHMLIAGAVGSGKSVLLRTLITSFTQTHSPNQLQLYLIDFGGQALRIFESLPHVGGVFGESDEEYINRLLRKLQGVIEERKQLCATQQVDDFLGYQRRRSDQATLPHMPAIFLVIDKFIEFKQAHEKEMETLLTIARFGRTYGIFLILTAERPLGISMQLLSLIELRIGLRLVEITDSLILLGKNDATTIDSSQPGRGYKRGKTVEEIQVALPVTAEDDDEQTRLLDQLVTEVAALSKAKKVQKAPSIRLLPDVVHLDYFLMDALAKIVDQTPGETATPSEKQQLRIRLGIEDFSLRPILLELNADSPHAMIVGGSGTGRSGILQTSLLSLACPDNRHAKVVLVDFRRSSRQLRRLPNVWQYADTEERLIGVVSILKEELRQRTIQLREEAEQQSDDNDDQPGATMTPIVLAIDDYDQLSSMLKNPILDLKEFFLQARDLHLHIIVAGQPGDFSRNDQLLTQVKACRVGVVLGGDPNDPQTLGVRISDLPVGRGYLVRRNQRTLVQVAHAAPSTLNTWVNRMLHSYAMSLVDVIESKKEETVEVVESVESAASGG